MGGSRRQGTLGSIRRKTGGGRSTPTAALSYVTVGLNHADESNLKYPHSAALVRLRGEWGVRAGIKAPREEPYLDFTDPVEEFNKCVYETI